MGLLEFFKEPAFAEPIQDEEKVKKTYSHFRWRMFYSCFIGYAMFYLCKKNIAAALPSMSKELGYSNLELGVIGSSLYLTYAIGTADRLNSCRSCKYLLCIELFCFYSRKIHFLWTSERNNPVVGSCLFLGM